MKKHWSKSAAEGGKANAVAIREQSQPVCKLLQAQWDDLLTEAWEGSIMSSPNRLYSFVLTINVQGGLDFVGFFGWLVLGLFSCLFVFEVVTYLNR